MGRTPTHGRAPGSGTAGGRAHTLTSALLAFFLLIALLQNSERRYDEALHHKIDAVAAGLADLMEHEAEPNREVLERHIEDLQASVGLCASSELG
jgi:hypothetical protein